MEIYDIALCLLLLLLLLLVVMAVLNITVPTQTPFKVEQSKAKMSVLIGERIKHLLSLSSAAAGILYTRILFLF